MPRLAQVFFASVQEAWDTGSFSPGAADDLEITYNTADATKIRVHARIHLTPDGQAEIRPAVPISFGPCLFSGMPCKAVHDFSLIPSPGPVMDPSEVIPGEGCPLGQRIARRVHGPLIVP